MLFVRGGKTVPAPNFIEAHRGFLVSRFIQLSLSESALSSFVKVRIIRVSVVEMAIFMRI